MFAHLTNSDLRDCVRATSARIMGILADQDRTMTREDYQRDRQWLRDLTDEMRRRNKSRKV